MLVPRETYTPDANPGMFGPWVVDSYPQRKAQCSPAASGEPWEVQPPPVPEIPYGEPVPQSAAALTGRLPSLALSFQGARSGDSGSHPPDTMGAVGPNHFMEVINGNVSIFRKSDGMRIASESLRCFFSATDVSGRFGDPRVLFDQHSDRWIAIASSFDSSFNGGRIFLAVSLTNNPTDLFAKTNFLAAYGSDAGAWPDFPTLGVDENGVYIGAYMVGRLMTIWAIEKAPLIANPPSMGTVTAWRGLLSGINQPPHTYGTPGSEYIIGREPVDNPENPVSDKLRIYRVEPPLTAPMMWDTGTVTVEGFSNPPETIPALGGDVFNRAGSRLMMSVYRDGYLWTTHSINVDGRAAARWYKIDPVARTVIQSGNVGDASLHFYFPSLMVNSAGDVAMGFSGSDAERYIGCYYTGRRASDTPGDMAVPQLLKAGEDPYQFPDRRWGDYSYTTLDPLDQSTFWTIQEYAHALGQYGSVWGTWIGVLRYVPCGVPGDCDDVNECTLDHCVDELCENIPYSDSTPCAGSVCCGGRCVCSSDADCDDGVECTISTCVNPGTCDAHCENLDCDPDTPNGCCGPSCAPCDDFDCHPPNEVLGSTCQDGEDNDCDGLVDCEDLADCAYEPACNCFGSAPLVCVRWAGPVPPEADQDFTITVPDPNNPDVTFLTGNNGWKVWSQMSAANATPANLGHIKLDPDLTLPTANFSLTIAHDASPGAANVASLALVKTNWTGWSSLSGSSIAGDLEGDLVLRESAGEGGHATFTIGGDVSGNITIPKVNTLQVNGSVALGATVTLLGFVGAKRAEFNTNAGTTFAGNLSLRNGLLPSGAVVIVHGLLADTAFVDFNGEALAESMLFYGGSAAQSVINVGRLGGLFDLRDGSYSGTANFSSIDPSGVITVDGANLAGKINVVGDCEGYIQVNGDMSGDIHVGGLINGNVTVSGEFNGDICDENLSPTTELPNIIQIGSFGPNATICGQALTVIVADADPLSPDRTTRSMRFRMEAPAITQQSPGPSAIKMTMIDLQHPNPPNLPANPPPNFTTFDTRLNGACVGGTIEAGHHCDVDADCPSSACGTLAACTAAGEANGCARWVGKPGIFREAQDRPSAGTYRAARLQCTPFYWDWVTETESGPITVVGAEILPSSEYSVQVYGASCMGAEADCANVSAPVKIYTRRYGDVESPFQAPSPAALSQPDVTDLAQLVNKFKDLPGALPKATAQLRPNLPELNADINALDIVAVVDAVKGFAYPFGGPCPCPSEVVCEATACATPTVCVTAYGAGATCVRTCTGGANDGEPCINNTHCPEGCCGSGCTLGSPGGFCRDRCGRCTP